MDVKQVRLILGTAKELDDSLIESDKRLDRPAIQTNSTQLKEILKYAELQKTIRFAIGAFVATIALIALMIVAHKNPAALTPIIQVLTPVTIAAGTSFGVVRGVTAWRDRK